MLSSTLVCKTFLASDEINPELILDAATPPPSQAQGEIEKNHNFVSWIERDNASFEATQWVEYQDTELKVRRAVIFLCEIGRYRLYGIVCGVDVIASTILNSIFREVKAKTNLDCFFCRVELSNASRIINSYHVKKNSNAQVNFVEATDRFDQKMTISCKSSSQINFDYLSHNELMLSAIGYNYFNADVRLDKSAELTVFSHDFSPRFLSEVFSLSILIIKENVRPLSKSDIDKEHDEAFRRFFLVA